MQSSTTVFTFGLQTVFPRMWLLEIIGDFLEALTSWRFYVCLIPALLGAYFLHEAFPGERWPWAISIPLMVSGFIIGLRWDWKSDH